MWIASKYCSTNNYVIELNMHTFAGKIFMDTLLICNRYLLYSVPHSVQNKGAVYKVVIRGSSGHTRRVGYNGSIQPS